MPVGDFRIVAEVEDARWQDVYLAYGNCDGYGQIQNLDIPWMDEWRRERQDLHREFLYFKGQGVGHRTSYVGCLVIRRANLGMH